MTTDPKDLDALLANAGWARALARSLVKGEDRADDLVQRAWLAALRRPPAEDVPPRRWLAAVMRNFARDDVREARRRERREHAVARRERVDAALDDAAEAQTRLLAAVRELPESIRVTVWARYYEGLAPREIAARDGVPVATVKTRLARGLDALRTRLDREHGGNRAAWVAAFLPLVESRHAGAWTVGALLVQTKIKVGLVLLVAACGLGAWWLARTPDVVVGSIASAPEALHAESSDAPAPQIASSEQTADALRRSVESAPATAPVEREPAAPVAARRGRVLDMKGNPVAGVEAVDQWDSPPAPAGSRAITGIDGRFELEVRPGASSSVVKARGDGWITVYAGQEAPYRGIQEITVIVAPAIAIGGVVLDADGAPVAEAEIEVEVDDTERRRLGEFVAGSYEIGARAKSDELGRFRFEAAPMARGIVAARTGAGRVAFAQIPREPRDDLVLRLPGSAVEVVTLRGRVIDAQGEPHPDALVALLERTTTSGEQGAFVLEVRASDLASAAEDPTRRPLELRAASQGLLPARLELPEPALIPALAAGREFVLQLGGPTLSIRGVVIDSQGQPVPLAEVDLVDEEHLGSVEDSLGNSRFSSKTTVESVLRGGAWRAAAKTDAAGTFEITDLQDRPYRLAAHAARLSARTEAGPFAAGARDAKIVLDTSSPGRLVAGRVTNARGEPVAGASVQTRIVLDGSPESHAGPSANAGPDGVFVIKAVRGRLEWVSAFASGYGHAHVQVAEGQPWTELAITLRRERVVQVEMSDRNDFADRYRLEDAEGRPVSLQIVQSTITSTGSMSVHSTLEEVPIEAGRSDLATVLEAPLTAVFLKGRDEVARMPVVWAAEGTTILSP